MPLVLNPDQTFRVVLESDKSKPKEEQPYFEFPYLSARDFRKIAEKADKVDEATSGADAIDKAMAILKEVLTGWGNMIDSATKHAIAFDLEQLDRIITLNETFELLMKMRNQGLEASDLKNSELPSESSSAASAENAPEQPSAEINPAK